MIHKIIRITAGCKAFLMLNSVLHFVDHNTADKVHIPRIDSINFFLIFLSDLFWSFFDSKQFSVFFIFFRPVVSSGDRFFKLLNSL